MNPSTPRWHGLALLKYGPLAASTRQRFVLAEPYLKAEGITFDIAPLFSDAQMQGWFATGRRNPLAVFRAYLQRLRLLFTAKRYDFVIVNYELFPYLPGWVEQLIGLPGKPVFYDCDDALFHQYDRSHNPLIRLLLASKIEPLLRKTQLAFCGNAYLEAYVRAFCPHTLLLPTTVDILRYQPAQSALTLHRPAVVGWIGSPSTWKFCLPMLPVLRRLVEQGLIEMLVIGAGAAATREAHPCFRFEEWNEEEEIADLQRMDIGIMPLPDGPWTRGKCGYKLIQYMACALPVVASPVGVNSTIVTHGEDGLLAETETEWEEALKTLAQDAARRKQLGLAGRKKVEAFYSIQTHGPRMAVAMRDVLKNTLSP